VIVALFTGVRCSDLVALKGSDFDLAESLGLHSQGDCPGRVDDVKTEYSEAPLALDPAWAEVIFERRRILAERVGFKPPLSGLPA
jgi:hypothetical protein